MLPGMAACESVLRWGLMSWLTEGSLFPMLCILFIGGGEGPKDCCDCIDGLKVKRGIINHCNTIPISTSLYPEDTVNMFTHNTEPRASMRHHPPHQYFFPTLHRVHQGAPCIHIHRSSQRSCNVGAGSRPKMSTIPHTALQMPPALRVPLAVCVYASYFSICNLWCLKHLIDQCVVSNLAGKVSIAPVPHCTCAYNNLHLN